MTLLKTAYGRKIFRNTTLLAVFLWIVIALFKFLWFPDQNTSLGNAFFPAKDLYDLMIRFLFLSMIILCGGIIAKSYLSISEARIDAHKKALQLSTTLNSISEGVITTDINGRITGMNRAAVHMTGFTAEDSAGHTIEDILNATEPEKLSTTFKKMSKHKTDISSCELEIKNTKKKNTHMVLSGSPITDNAGNKTGYVFSCRDTTDTKMAETLLQENEKKLRSLFASMTEMVVFHELQFDAKGNPCDYRITGCNLAYTATTGITKEMAIGQLASTVYKSNPPPYLEEFAPVAISGKTYEYSTYFPPMDKYFLVSVVNVGHNKFATITTDITAIKKKSEKGNRKKQTTGKLSLRGLA